jgi:hypothetical protein
VHDAARVQILEAPQYLPDVHARQRLGAHTELRGLHQRRQRAVLRELQHDVHVRVVLHHPAKRDDVLVRAELGQQLDLQTQRSSRLVIQPTQRDLLHRHHRAVARVDGLVHLAVRALADLLAQHVRAHGGVPAGRLRELHRPRREKEGADDGRRLDGGEGGGKGHRRTEARHELGISSRPTGL